MTTVPATLDSPEAPPPEAARRGCRRLRSPSTSSSARRLSPLRGRTWRTSRRCATAGSRSSCSRPAPRSRSCSSSSLPGAGATAKERSRTTRRASSCSRRRCSSPPPLAALVPVVQHLPEWLKKRQPWYIATFNIVNYTLTVLAALAVNRWVLERDGIVSNAHARTAVAGLAACAAYVLVNHGLLAAMFRLGRNISIRESGLFAGESVSAEFVLAALGVGSRVALELEPLAAPARARADRPDQPLARGARAAAAGAHRPEDEPLQRAPLRRRARGRAVARRAVRAAALAAHVRPRPAPRHQQRLRPSRRRRGAPRRRRRLPRGAPPLRHPGALRRRGVLDPPAGDRPPRRRSRSPTGSGARSRRAASRSRRRASRSARRSRSASRRSRRTRPAPTSSSTRPTSPSTARSSRAGTASSRPAPSRAC